MNEKPFRLDMGLDEALRRLAQTPKKQARTQDIDFIVKKDKIKNGAVKKPRRSTGKFDPVG